METLALRLEIEKTYNIFLKKVLTLRNLKMKLLKKLRRNYKFFFEKRFSKNLKKKIKLHSIEEILIQKKKGCFQ